MPEPLANTEGEVAWPCFQRFTASSSTARKPFSPSAQPHAQDKEGERTLPLSLVEPTRLAYLVLAVLWKVEKATS
jgi:hypothetical protein